MIIQLFNVIIIIIINIIIIIINVIIIYLLRQELLVFKRLTIFPEGIR